MGEVVRVGREGAIATVILDRAKKLNALDKEMWTRLGDVMAELSADEGVRCVLLRGAGERAFSVGADIAEFARERADTALATAYGGLMHRAMAAVGACPHPHGGADPWRLRGRRARDRGYVRSPHLRRIEPFRRARQPDRRGHGLSRRYRLCWRWWAGPGRLRFLLEARVFGAAEAKEMGLVNRVVPDGEVAGEAAATARRIADGAPLVNRWHKKFARRLADPRPLDAAEEAEGFATFGTEDFREGYRAFLEKRPPRFRGR